MKTNFIKLTTRFNTPIWVNFAYVITMSESSDGMVSLWMAGDNENDFTVKESASEILSLLKEADE